MLGESRAVVWRGIVVTDACIPCRLQAGDGGIFGHHGAEIAQRCRAEAERARRSVAGHACSCDGSGLRCAKYTAYADTRRILNIFEYITPYSPMNSPKKL